jgi:hypothetical protein
MMRASEFPAHARTRVVPIEQAALRAVAYADVFDYPLQEAEVHRYLHGVAATREATVTALARCSGRDKTLCCREGFYTLPGREGLLDIRRRRAACARRLWPAAVHYGHLIAGLPFVRMVAVTGSLVWDNVEDQAYDVEHPPDIDYLIVTDPDRLWLCRWLVAALSRVARLDGVLLCPNYMVSTRALLLAEPNLYGAYELARMTPIAGLGMYRRLRRANRWADAYLPNAHEPPRPPQPEGNGRPGRARGPWMRMARLGETVLGSALGTVLEQYEMRYRIRKRAKQALAQGEASYGVDWYKHHVGGHRHRALAAFADRLRTLGQGDP